MGDDDWDNSAIIRSYNINRSNNVVWPNLGIEMSEIMIEILLTHNYHLIVKKISIEYLVDHQEKSNYRTINMNQNDNQ